MESKTEIKILRNRVNDLYSKIQLNENETKNLIEEIKLLDKLIDNNRFMIMLDSAILVVLIIGIIILMP